jgi:perosamine synthetase
MISLFETIITPKAKKLVNQVLDSGFLNQGKIVDEFEKQLEEQLWMENPVTLNSCTSALHLALIISGVKKGDKVILPAQTFISTGLAVLMADAEPIFCDIDERGNIDTQRAFELAIRHEPRAIIGVHWAGYPCDLQGLLDCCTHIGNNNCKLIEDAAHAIGANYRNSTIGDCAYSDFCCFSLQSIKSLTTADGGILCSKSSKDKISKLRWFGIDKKQVQRNENGERIFDLDELGYKYHMNDYTAALGLGNLEGLKERINRRYGYAQIYNQRLEGTSGIISLPVPKDNKPSHWLYTMLVENRNNLILKLKSCGVMASTVDTRIDRKSVFNTRDLYLPGQNRFEAKQVSIPCTSSMSLDDVNYIIEKIKEGW